MARRDTLAKEGIAISRKVLPWSFGQRNDTILREWLGAAATAERIEQIGSAKEELYRELVRKNGMQALPGVAVWIHSLHEEGGCRPLLRRRRGKTSRWFSMP